MTAPCILLFGHTGALGSATRAALIEAGHDVECLNTRHYTNGHTFPKLITTIASIMPSHIINCAAMVGLDRCYENMREASRINTMVPHVLAVAAEKAKSRFLHFSTEGVFPCNRAGETYGETDKTGPTTIYGTTKLNGEPNKGTTIRLPLLYGPTADKHMLGKLIRMMLDGQNIRASDDVFSTPVYIPDVARYVVKWVRQTTEHHSLLHLGSDQLVSIYVFLDMLLSKLGMARPLRRHELLARAHSNDFPCHELKPQHGGLHSNYIPPMSLDSGLMKYADYLQAQKGRKDNERTKASARANC